MNSYLAVASVRLPTRRCYHQFSIICFQLETYNWWANLEGVSYLWRKQEMATLNQEMFCNCLKMSEEKISFI